MTGSTHLPTSPPRCGSLNAPCAHCSRYYRNEKTIRRTLAPHRAEMDPVLPAAPAGRARDRTRTEATVSGPRNRQAVARSERAREAIFQAWGELVLEFAYSWPARRPPTAKDIARRLPDRYRRLSERSITWHMARIAIESQTGELCPGEGCGSGNSSAAEARSE